MSGDHGGGRTTVLPAGFADRWWAPLVTESARPRRVARWPHAHWLAVGTVCFGAFMGQLDASIVTLTFPALTGAFHTPLGAVEWVSLGYLLALVALLTPVGRVSDLFGRKLVYLQGFVVFTGASALCGLAPTLSALVGFRVLQAVGAAMMQANSVALVATSVPRPSMRAALGVQAAAQALGLALGPTVGGLLVTGLGWQWVFWVNVPIGVAAVVAGRFLLPRTRARTPIRRFDLAGLVLLATASTAALLAVSVASGLPLPPAAVAALLALAVAAGWGLLRVERRAASPLVDLGLLRRGGVAAGLTGALCGYLVLFGPLVVVPVALVGRGLSTAHAGAVLTALPAGFALAATLGGCVLPRRWSDARRGRAGAAVCVLALAALLVLPLRPGVLAPLLGLLGVGLGVFTPANNAAIMGRIPASSAGVGGGLVNMTRGLGTALGVAFSTLALHLAPAEGPRVAVAVLVAAALVAGASTRATRACRVRPSGRAPGAP
ncbi:MFS transporter [Gandjariella thermophila]|uniref:MFS transporter n=1 Tax=Gandjariella thermophila TaxID=1931992 RepID=A0A4D4J5S7_9PSEU|nr:MFS transporter [Gandjariella thermophila]GDY30452.1 MFS transporter [Gandjariella thermophila]